jgi:hypothetical protein
MLSKTELEYLKSPKAFDSEYQRILRHRIRAKVQQLKQEVGLLGNRGFLGEFYAYGEESGMNQAYSWNRDLHSGGLGFKSPPVHLTWFLTTTGHLPECYLRFRKILLPS